MDSRRIPPAFMPMPEDCGRGGHPVFGGVTCVDTVICHYYCTRSCEAYSDFHKDQRKKNRKGRGRRTLRNGPKPKRQTLELAVKPRRQALELAKPVKRERMVKR